jgi:Ca2+-transporting ATPase
MSLALDGVATPSLEQGLTPAAAAERLARDGRNELPQERRRSPLRIVVDAVREPMLQLLLAAGVIYLLIGDLAEALILLGFAVLNVVLVAIQESRTERALAALKDLTSPVATVVRDGRRLRVPSAEIVAGDLVVLTEGDRVPADAVLLDAAEIEADESLLTGESVPVRKRAGREAAGTAPTDVRPGGDDSPRVWSGTLIVRGTGLARVLSTGARTEIGRIGTSLGTVDAAPTPLQVQTRRLVRVFAALGIGASVALAIGYGLLLGEWLRGVLAGITLAMATLPEEFPLVLTVFLVLGAWRMSQRKVLTRRSAAIEALGAATVLCTDKTGTLTVNRMSVATLVAASAGARLDRRWTRRSDGAAALPEEFHRLVEFAILASRPDPFDPMERAFRDLGEDFLAQTEHLRAGRILVHGFPLGAGLLAMSQIWRDEGGASFVAAAKGAPEAVALLCRLTPEEGADLARNVADLAAEGLRVLAIAAARCEGPPWPETQFGFRYDLVGLVGLADPLRPEVPAAVAACITGGIRVVMITGDHPATALAIARQAGIKGDQVLTGSDMAALADAELGRRLTGTNVFARIMPEQKLRLVQAFAAAGQVVAMTGDGVNDAPSLKAAHIGVAMGGRGTDVAREAASLVLLDDNFASLVAAVRLGRRIDDNLRKAIGYILAVHVPIAGLSLLPVLLGWPMVLGPIHVVCLELIIDPVSSIVFEAEPEEENIMARPPRMPDAPLFDAALLWRGLLQGGVVMIAALTIFRLGLHDEHGEQVARCMAFVTLVLGNLGLVLTNRSTEHSAFRVLTRPNRALLIVVVITMATLALSVSLPWLRALFGFAPPGWPRLAEAAGAAGVCVVLNDLLGMVFRRATSSLGARRLRHYMP